MIYRAIVTLKRISGITRDAVTNTFHFLAPNPLSEAEFGDLCDAIENFYLDADPGTTSSIAMFLSSAINRGNVHTIQVYDQAAPAGSSPEFVRTFDLPGANGTPVDNKNLPAEVAVCLSFASFVDGVVEEAGATRPAARKRNRLYIGPLNAGAAAVDATSKEAYIWPNCANTIIQAAERLFGWPSAGAWGWAQYSPTTGQALSPQHWWVDGAFDTQRRRGERAVTRYELFA